MVSLRPPLERDNSDHRDELTARVAKLESAVDTLEADRHWLVARLAAIAVELELSR